jgi:hypothetical protein
MKNKYLKMNKQKETYLDEDGDKLITMKKKQNNLDDCTHVAPEGQFKPAPKDEEIKIVIDKVSLDLLEKKIRFQERQEILKIIDKDLAWLKSHKDCKFKGINMINWIKHIKQEIVLRNNKGVKDERRKHGKTKI